MIISNSYYFNCRTSGNANIWQMEFTICRHGFLINASWNFKTFAIVRLKDGSWNFPGNKWFNLGR